MRELIHTHEKKKKNVTKTHTHTQTHMHKYTHIFTAHDYTAKVASLDISNRSVMIRVDGEG